MGDALQPATRQQHTNLTDLLPAQIDERVQKAAANQIGLQLLHLLPITSPLHGGGSWAACVPVIPVIPVVAAATAAIVARTALCRRGVCCCLWTSAAASSCLLSHMGHSGSPVTTPKTWPCSCTVQQSWQYWALHHTSSAVGALQDLQDKPGNLGAHAMSRISHSQLTN